VRAGEARRGAIDCAQKLHAVAALDNEARVIAAAFYSYFDLVILPRESGAQALRQ
jgi:hypothetical protein